MKSEERSVERRATVGVVLFLTGCLVACLLPVSAIGEQNDPSSQAVTKEERRLPPRPRGEDKYSGVGASENSEPQLTGQDSVTESLPRNGPATENNPSVAAELAKPAGSQLATGDAPDTSGVAHDYRIGYGDSLRVSVWKEPEASVPSVPVRSDGKISLPLVKEVRVVGLTPAELERLLTEEYARFIAAPDVAVVMTEINSEKVYLVGGVTGPGTVQLTSPMTVLQVLAVAGGFTEYAKKNKVYVLRRMGGETQRFLVPYKQIVQGKEQDKNILVRPGDTIVVPE